MTLDSQSIDGQRESGNDSRDRRIASERLSNISIEERRRRFPMGIGLFPQAVPFLTRWRHLRWFLIFWLPNLIAFLVLLPGHHRLMEHILLGVLSPVFLAIAFVSVQSGIASSNQGSFFRQREPVRFWLSAAVPAVCYMALTGAYFVLGHGT